MPFPATGRSRWVIGCIVLAAVTVLPELAAQTLFARPDTSPNYLSYRHIEECQSAILRLTDEHEARKEPIWYDTVKFGMRDAHNVERATSRRPDTATTVATACLRRFDADTAQFRNYGYGTYMVQLLLMAHRDEDAHRFAQRLLDSMRQRPAENLKSALYGLITVYGNARPGRLNEVKRYYAELLVALKHDSLYRTVDVAITMTKIAQRLGDTASFEEAAWHAIRTNDATPVEERRKSPNSPNRLLDLRGLLTRLTSEEGLDSIAISTMAFEMYLANTVNARVYGEESRRTPKDIELFQVPDVVGEHYYVASNASSSDAASQEPVPYRENGTVPQNEIPVRGRINVIWGLPVYCHAEGSYRWIEEAKIRGVKARACVKGYAMLRRMKQRFPDVEITLLASTYGTVGQLGPLTPANEADTLAKLWLGFHRIPGRLVVEERPFFHVPEPDGRRIDLPTPYAKALKSETTYPLFYVTDKEGNRVSPIGQSEDDVFNRFLDILIKRAGK